MYERKNKFKPNKILNYFDSFEFANEAIKNG